ncbi:ABC transporter permease [bacterium]|jgi:ABC-2 type transport system permease protein|nr:ABC transporter permease [bacterium]
MKEFLALTKKELRFYFQSPVAYIILAAFLSVTGYMFYIYTGLLSIPGTPGIISVMRFFFGGTWLFWVLLLMVPPSITMRLFSEEYKTGTIEIIKTSPLKSWHVILSKIAGGYIFFLFLWLPTFSYVLIVALFGKPDMGPILCSYIGTALAGIMLISIGVFTSSLSKNQLVSYMLAIAISFIFLTIGVMEDFVSDSDWKAVISFLSFPNNFANFPIGIIDLESVVYFISFSWFFILLTFISYNRKGAGE